MDRIGSSVRMLLGQGNSMLQVVELLASRGLGAEIWTSHPGYQPYSDQDIAALCAAIQKLPFATAHSALSAWQPDALRKEIALCARLGVSLLVVHGSTLGVEESLDLPDYPTISALAARAKEMQVLLALENGYTGGLQAVVSTIERIGDDPIKSGLGICIDTWRACRAQDRVRNSVYDYLRTVGKQLVHIHVDDVSSGGHALPGRGEIEWRRVSKILEEIGYTGKLVLEMDCGDDPLQEICAAQDYLAHTLSCLPAP